MSRCPACGSETVGARCVVCGAPSVEGEAPRKVGYPPTPLYPEDTPPPAWTPQQPWPAAPASYPPVVDVGPEPRGRSVGGGLALGIGAGLALLGLGLGALAVAGRLPVPAAAGGPGTTPPTTAAPAPTRTPASLAPQADPVLVDLQPGTGLRLHQVQVSAPATLPPGRSVVVWISAEHGGAPNRPHTYPYAVVGAGEVRTVALHLGNEGGGDVGARFVAEACVAGGTTLTLVNGYLRELNDHGPAEEAFRAEGIAVPGAGGDYTCPSAARLTLTRTG